jgi:hypothetical protein
MHNFGTKSGNLHGNGFHSKPSTNLLTWGSPTKILQTLMLIHVPEISLVLTECNPHYHTCKRACRPTLVAETIFSPYSPFWKTQVLRAPTPCRWRNSSSRQSVTARNTGMFRQTAVTASNLSLSFLIKTSRQHAWYHTERYLGVSRRRPWYRTYLRRRTVPADASSTNNKAAIIRDTIKGTRCIKTLRVKRSF